MQNSINANTRILQISGIFSPLNQGFLQSEGTKRRSKKYLKIPQNYIYEILKWIIYLFFI